MGVPVGADQGGDGDPVAAHLMHEIAKNAEGGHHRQGRRGSGRRRQQQGGEGQEEGEATGHGLVSGMWVENEMIYHNTSCHHNDAPAFCQGSAPQPAGGGAVRAVVAGMAR